jgi:hypothetical protein
MLTNVPIYIVSNVCIAGILLNVIKIEYGERTRSNSAVQTRRKSNRGD